MLPADIDVIVVGGGAAGMMAAVAAADQGEKVLLLEKNEKTGKKLYITGKGRCNFTNSCDVEDFFSQVVSNAKFLYSCIYGFSNRDVIDWFTAEGLRVKEERGGRMFPVSDKSSDVIRVLDKACRDRHVQVVLHAEVNDLLTTEDENRVIGVSLSDGRKIHARRVILATGGVSYPSTGSTGDGLRMAEKLGHTIVTLRPGLTGLSTKETDIRELQGLTLINTSQTVREVSGKKKLLEGFGEILFTHFGVSGPTMLTVSSKLGDRLKEYPLLLTLDIKPALSEEELDKRVIREIEADGKKSIGNLAGRLLPKSLIPVLLNRCYVDPQRRGFDLTRDERLRFVKEMKSFAITLTGVRDFNEAIITRGGISVKDVNPQTMESKIISGLYFAGEILDVDALTGGYNLQIAWSTGVAAGRAER